MVACTDGVKGGTSLKNVNFPSTKSHSSKSTTTEISIPDTECYQTNCKRFEKQISHISRAIHHVHSTKNNTFSSRVFCVKTVGLILLFCDIVYLNFYLSRTESALQLTLRKIEKLETELSYSRLTTKILRSDFNSAKNENSRISHDIITTLSSLLKHKEAYMQHSNFDDNNILDHLFVRQNDNTVRHFVQKSDDNKLEGVDNGLLTFSYENLKLPPKSEEPVPSTKSPQINAYIDLENNGAVNYADNINGFVYKSEDGFNLDERTIFFPNETVQSASAIDEDVGTRRRREVHSERRGPLAVILRGIHPEVIIEDGGLIAPWVADRNGAGDYPFKDFNFREGNGKIEISEKGLFLIYAQVFYLSSNHLNGFSINMQKSKAEADSEIARCSVDIASKRTSEVSCFTSVIRQLLPGDKVYLVQRERNSRILHGEGYTYFGLVALNNPPKC